MLPMMSGPPSWPRNTPVENVHATTQLAGIGRGNLVELRVARIGVVACRHHPILRILRHLDQFFVGIGCTGGEHTP